MLGSGCSTPVSKIHLLTGDNGRAGRVICAACVAPSDSEESTAALNPCLRSPVSLGLGPALLCRPPPLQPQPLSPACWEPQLALSRSPCNLLHFREFPIPTGRTRCHGDVSLPTPRPAREAKSFPASPPGRPGSAGSRPALWEKGLGSRSFALGGRRKHQLRILGKREGEGRQMAKKVLLKVPGRSARPRHPPGHLSPELALVLGGNVRHSAFLSTASKNRGAFFKLSGTQLRE